MIIMKFYIMSSFDSIEKWHFCNSQVPHRVAPRSWGWIDSVPLSSVSPTLLFHHPWAPSDGPLQGHRVRSGILGIFCRWLWEVICFLNAKVVVSLVHVTVLLCADSDHIQQNLQKYCKSQFQHIEKRQIDSFQGSFIKHILNPWAIQNIPTSPDLCSLSN